MKQIFRMEDIGMEEKKLRALTIKSYPGAVFGNSTIEVTPEGMVLVIKFTAGTEELESSGGIMLWDEN